MRLKIVFFWHSLNYVEWVEQTELARTKCFEQSPVGNRSEAKPVPAPLPTFFHLPPTCEWDFWEGVSNVRLSIRTQRGLCVRAAPGIAFFCVLIPIWSPAGLDSFSKYTSLRMRNSKQHGVVGVFDSFWQLTGVAFGGMSNRCTSVDRGWLFIILKNIRWNVK